MPNGRPMAVLEKSEYWKENRIRATPTSAAIRIVVAVPPR